jgi:hypothetical protein
MPTITVKYRRVDKEGHTDTTQRVVYVGKVSSRAELDKALKDIPKDAIVLYFEKHKPVRPSHVNGLFP